MLQVLWSDPSVGRELPKAVDFYVRYRGGFCLFVTLDEMMEMFKRKPKPVACGPRHLMRVWKYSPSNMSRWKTCPGTIQPTSNLKTFSEPTTTDKGYQFYLDGRPVGSVHRRWQGAAKEAVDRGFAHFREGKSVIQWVSLSAFNRCSIKEIV